MNIANVKNDNPYQMEPGNTQQDRQNNPQPPNNEEVEIQQNRDEYIPAPANETQERGVAPLVNTEPARAGGNPVQEVEENNIRQAAPANENEALAAINENPTPEPENVNPAAEPENENPAPEPERANTNIENPNNADRTVANREHQIQQERVQKQLEAAQNTARDNRSRILDLLV